MLKILVKTGSFIAVVTAIASFIAMLLALLVFYISENPQFYIQWIWLASISIVIYLILTGRLIINDYRVWKHL